MNGLTLTIQSPPEVEPERRAVSQLPAGEAGTAATIAAMVGLIRESATHPLVRIYASTFTIYKEPRSLAAAVFNWLHRFLKFKKDPPGLEFLRHPARILADVQRLFTSPLIDPELRPLADCDDIADLGSSLLLAAGLRPVLIVVATKPNGPFVHVYFGIREGDGYWPLDPQELSEPGHEVTAPRRRVFDVT